MVLADAVVQDLVLDRAELTHEVRATDRRGAGGDADLRAQATGDGVELGVRDFKGLNLGSRS